MRASLTYLLVIVLYSGHAAASNPLGFDLSYSTVFKENGIPENDTVAKLFRDANARQKGFEDMAIPSDIFKSYTSDNVETLVVLDYQVFWYFGHRMIMVVVQKKDGQILTWSWDSKEGYHDGEKNIEGGEELSVLLNWKATPQPPGYPKTTDTGHVYSGYIGVLSVYDEGDIRQALLVENDILKQGEDGEPVPGNLMKMVMDLF
jgi:hypothetical protein